MPLADRALITDPVRLEALRATGLLDSEAEECFDRYTRLAGRLIGAPIALLGVVDAHRQFLKSRHGVEDVTETPLSHSFCQHVVAGDAPLVIEDARTHPLVHDNGAVADFGVIAYAGVPVRAGGQTLGAFCVLDHRPTRFSAEQVATLEDLAAACTAEIELRLAFDAERRAKDALHRQAYCDALTGLPNRRALLEDLTRVVHERRPGGLVLLDLDGFKAYNDRHGHLGGDDLLRALAGRLGAAVADRAYRLGGDEFCVLALDADSIDDVAVAARRALSAPGPECPITASAGVVRLPDDAGTASGVLRIADTRMYAEKRGNRGSARRQVMDALVQTIAERDGRLAAHASGVATLATAVARALGLPDAAVDDVRDAAELHHIGSLALPGTVADGDAAVVQAQSEVGHRILAAAPVLRPVADIVRASRERFDGHGLPDGLAGEDIPLGARIVSACDAFQAMAGDPRDRTALPAPEALAALERRAGTQFDPAVVDAIRAVVIPTAVPILASGGHKQGARH